MRPQRLLHLLQRSQTTTRPSTLRPLIAHFATHSRTNPPPPSQPTNTPAPASPSLIALSTTPINTGNPFSALDLELDPDDAVAAAAAADTPRPTRFNPSHTSTPPPRATQMASDDDYAAFLERASAPADKPAGDAGVETRGKGVSTHAQAPAALVQAVRGRYYASEADEEFEAVGVEWGGSALGSGGFPRPFSLWGESTDLNRVGAVASIAGVGEGEVREMRVGEFDPRGEYGDLVSKVGEVGGGEVKVFRVERGRARCEYWVVTLAEGKVVGVKVKAIES